MFSCLQWVSQHPRNEGTLLRLLARKLNKAIDEKIKRILSYGLKIQLE